MKQNPMQEIKFALLLMILNDCHFAMRAQQQLLRQRSELLVRSSQGSQLLAQSNFSFSRCLASTGESLAAVAYFC